MKLKSSIALLLTISLTLLSVGCLSFPKSSYRATKEFDLGNFPSILKSIAIPCSFLRGKTFANFIADKESTATENPATPKAIKCSTQELCNAI